MPRRSRAGTNNSKGTIPLATLAHPPESISAAASGVRSPAAYVLLALLPTWVGLGWLVSKAQWFWQRNPELNFGWIVLLLCLYLFWEEWERRPADCLRWTPGTLSVSAIGLAVLLLTQLYQNAYGLTAASMSGLGLGVLFVISANLAFVFGAAHARRFYFGFWFILIALPIPSVIYAPLVSGLQSFIAGVNVEILRLIGIPARQVGDLIQLSTGTVGINEACSGIRSLQSTVMATLFIGHLTFKSKGLQTVLFVGGMLLAVLGNVIRSLWLSYTAHSHGLKAVETAHDTAGWSILAFTAVGVIVLAWALSKAEAQARAEMSKQATQAGALEAENPPSA